MHSGFGTLGRDRGLLQRCASRRKLADRTGIMTPSDPPQLRDLPDPDVLGAADAEDFDVLTRVASLVTGSPMAFVSFVGTERVWSHGSGYSGSSTPREESFCSRALLEEEMLVTADVRTDERTRAIAARRQDTSVVSYAGALVKTDDGRKLGTLCVMDTHPRELSVEQQRLLRGLARQVMNLVELRRAKRELTDALQRMTVLATTDELTGCLSRRAFFEQGEDLRRLVARTDGAMSIALVDLDHFKRINDTHGHAAGDEVLRRVGQALRARLRSTDKVGRIGGEELALALPFTALDAAVSLVDELRQAIAGMTIGGPSGPLRVTCSIGVAAVRADDASLEAPLGRADAALYAAKASGRDRVQREVTESAKPA